MKLLVGLGNPGKKYSLTRHNVGFLLINQFVDYYQWPKLKLEKRFKAKFAKIKLSEKNISRFTLLSLKHSFAGHTEFISGSQKKCHAELVSASQTISQEILNPPLKRGRQVQDDKCLNRDLIIALPQTYMNNSGLAVKKICQYYKIKPEDIIIVHDDIDLNFGKFKISFDSRSAGHQGAQSIINELGTKKFYRLRIGIGPEKKPVNFLTEKFVLENFKKEEIKKLENLFEILNQEVIKLI